jgi:hypothetical protein
MVHLVHFFNLSELNFHFIQVEAKERQAFASLLSPLRTPALISEVSLTSAVSRPSLARDFKVMSLQSLLQSLRIPFGSAAEAPWLSMRL